MDIDRLVAIDVHTHVHKSVNAPQAGKELRPERDDDQRADAAGQGRRHGAEQ